MAAHMTKLNVIGNNIANANTYGFKSSRVVFTDVLYQNLSSAAAGDTETGGINSSQLGYGAKVGSIDVNNGISSGADTGRALDVYINGEGYIPVKTNEGAIRYTRVGDLRFDTEGNLTDGSGSRVLGIPTKDGKLDLKDDGTIKIENLAAIHVDPAELEKYTGIAIGPTGEITGIKSGDPVAAFNAKAVGVTSGAVDKESNYTGDIKMTTTIKDNKVKFTEETVATDPAITYQDDIAAEDINLIGDLTMTKATDTNGNITYTLTGKKQDGTDTSIPGTEVSGTVSFPLKNVAGTVLTTLTFSVVVTTALANGSYKLGTVTAEKMTVSATIKDKGGTDHVVTGDWNGTDTEINLASADADTKRTLSLNVDKDKFATIGTLSNVIVGTVKTDDAPQKIGQMAVVKFANPDGLSREGDGYYAPGANSGDPIATSPGKNGTGSLKSSSLEMSNVDIAAEFAEMITAQRGFQANTRLITVSDSILEELINLKR